MPKLNGMGPLGQGPMTGKGMGNCRAGRGLGFRRRFRSSKNEFQALEEEEKMLQEELEAIKEEKEALKETK